MRDTVVVVVAGENVRTGFMLSMLDAVWHPRVRDFVVVQGGPFLTKVRNESVRQFLETDGHWALFIDSDMVFTPEHVSMLYEPENDVTCGVTKNDQGKDVELGASFMLVRREVLEEMREGWFNVRFNEDGVQQGEDISFLRRAADAGFNVTVAREIKVGHLKVVDVARRSS